MNPVQRMKELIAKLNVADAAYFRKDDPIMTDREYDSLLLELTMLERATGVHFSDSPVGSVPSDAKQGLTTVRHSEPMLSCQKTRSTDDVMKFALGAITDDRVSESTDYLIYGAMPGSKKVDAALENGVNMISEKTFAEMLRQNN